VFCSGDLLRKLTSTGFLVLLVMSLPSVATIARWSDLMAEVSILTLVNEGLETKKLSRTFPPLVGSCTRGIRPVHVSIFGVPAEVGLLLFTIFLFSV